MALLVAKLGKTIIHMAFANFGICGGPFLGLILTGVGGFGGIFGIEKFRISPLWWTPIGCLTNLMLCFIGTMIQRRIINQIPENTKPDKTKKYEIQELLQN